jgi:flagellar protein FliO/FliZ
MNGFTSLLWFVAVLAAIPLVLWLLRRTPLGGAATGGAGAPRTVAVLPGLPGRGLRMQQGTGPRRSLRR